MSDTPQVRIALHACADCGAVVVDQERHFDWHAASKDGAGRGLDHRADYELIGFIEPPSEDQLLPGEDLMPGEDRLVT